MNTALLLELDTLAAAEQGGQASAGAAHNLLERIVAEIQRHPDLLDDPASIDRTCRRAKRHCRELVLSATGNAEDLVVAWAEVIARLPLPQHDDELDVFRRIESLAAATASVVAAAQQIVALCGQLEQLKLPELAPTVQNAAGALARLRREVAKAIRIRTEPMSPEVQVRLDEALRPDRPKVWLTAEQAKEYARSLRAGQ